MTSSYRKGVGAVIINKNKHIFLGKRNDVKHAWQMPQGGIDDNEDSKIALFRELDEEIGISNPDKFKILGVLKNLKYDLPETIQKKFFGGQFKGQIQDWFFLEFLGNDNDFKLDKYSNYEFIEWKWANKNEAIELIVDFKKNLYQKIFEFALLKKIL